MIFKIAHRILDLEALDKVPLSWGIEFDVHAFGKNLVILFFCKYFFSSFNASELFTLPKIKWVLWTSNIELFLSGEVGIKKIPIELKLF